MRISEIEERLADYGSGGYYLLESFLLQLLKIEADSQKKPLQLENRRSHSRYDAFAPNGIADVPGPLAIEIVQVLSPKRLDSEILRHESFLSNDDEKLLIVSFREMAKSSKYVQHLKSRSDGRVFFWGAEEVQALLDKHSEKATALSKNMFSIRLRRAISKSHENWKEKRTEVLAEVCEYYRSGRFSMFLGAGVSSSAGLPDWDTLLNSLFVSMLTEGGVAEKKIENEQVSSIVKRLRQVDGPSALMLARYLRRGLSAGSGSEQSKFIRSVTEQLYGLRNQRFSLSSPLIKAIASLCTPSRTGAKIKSVLTYNFDDLLERELENRQLAFRSIFEEIDLAGPEELPIYHVHGFFPEDRDNYPSIEKATLVFSEEGYHQIYGDAYHWSNLIQLNSLKENACLMVGLSLTDPNLRRLLEISSKSIDKPKHFAFLKRVDYESFSKEKGKPIVRAPISLVRTFLDRHHSLNEEVMKELGVNIIWYEDYEDIPKLLVDIGKGI
ncbi:SIR2 family protein [Alloalcanivorax xenomutans]|uniref:SIR2 family protein n=1 Tax=Alloalcanivorax xenomutans TaxID=1094342 RepID=UPI003BA998D0